MADSTTTQMPMGASAKLPLTAADLLPSIRPPASAMPAPPATAPGPSGTMGAPLGFPAPDAPAEPPYSVEMQPDGSAIWKSKTEPPVVIGVVPAPKLPPSLQPPTK